MKKRGRPKKHPIDIMRTKAWYAAVQLKLGLPSANKVERHIEAENQRKKEDKFIGVRRWAGYKNGERVPPDIPGLLNAIDMAEKEATNTALWFRSPLWTALKGELPNRYDFENAFAKSDAIAAIIFEFEPLELGDEDHAFFGRDENCGTGTSRRFSPKSIYKCIELEGIDLLEAVVLLLEFGRSSQSLEIMKPALALYEAASRKFAAIPQLKCILRDVFEAIEDKYLPRFNTNYDEFCPPWHVRMPDLYEKIVDIEAMREEALKPYESDGGQLQNAD